MRALIRNMNICLLFLLPLSVVVRLTWARIVFPHVPDILNPPTPDGGGSSASVDNADDPSDDPEQSPGLFQGDIAIDKMGHSYWKVGLKCVYENLNKKKTFS